MRRLRILLVDDSRAFVEELAARLSSLSQVEVVGVAHSGQAALDLFDERAADLVLMDLAMPGMNGIQATRALKARGEAPRVWIVTLQDDSISRSLALAAGADQFVPKPLLLERLLEVLPRGAGPEA